MSRPGILDLAWGHPHPEALPVHEWTEAAEQTLTREGWRALTYGYAAGPRTLRAWLASRLEVEANRGCDPSEIFVTAGASHALYLLTSLLTQPGDVVVVDTPTYHLALRILRDAELDIVHAPVGGNGIDLQRLAELVKDIRDDGRRVRYFYLVPTFSNPTGRSLDQRQRSDLLDLARELHLCLIEDDAYHDLAYEVPSPRPLWSLSDGAPVIRIGSFSKTVAPGLRLGWINAAGDIVNRLEALGYVDSGGGVNHMMAMTMAVFCDSGAYDKHLARLRQRYAMQRDALTRALMREMPSLTIDSPPGGWFIWLGLPDDARATSLLPVAERHGVSFMPGPAFYADGRGDDHVRLSFSMLGPEDLDSAATRLATALREGSSSAR